MLDRKLLLELISAGIKASSPDNSQPWKFKLHADGIELRLNKKLLGMFFDANCYASLLGCGGVIENIRLIAATKGFHIRITRYDTVEPEYKVAFLQLVETDVVIDSLSTAVNKRCTHRGFFYKNRDISHSIVKAIDNSVKESSDTPYIHWFEEKQRQKIIQIITDTDRIRYTHKELHHDFYSKLRFGKEIKEKNDGLAEDTLGLEKLFRWSLPLLKSWTVATMLNRIGMHYFMAFRGAKVPLKNASKIGALVMRREDDILLQGAALHRLWLSVNQMDDLHFQPFGAFPLFIFRIKELNGIGFDEKQKQFLQTKMKQLDDLIGLNSETERVIILFRIGYAPPPTAYSRRRPIESFLID